MGLAVYISKTGTEKVEMVPIAGINEIESLWKPVIQKHDLKFLDYIVSAGLSIDMDNITHVKSELEILIANIQCKRTISTILNHKNNPLECLQQPGGIFHATKSVNDRKTAVLGKAHRKLQKLGSFEKRVL